MTPRFRFRNKDKYFQALRKTVPGLDKELRSALAEGGEEMVEQAKSYVPVNKGKLRNSIEWDFTRNTQIEARLSPAIIVTAGGKDNGFYAPFVEHGTANTARQPFFFPAYRSLRKRIRGRLSRAMTKAIKKAGFG